LKKENRSDKLYLEDLLTAMNRIDAVVRNFEIIGEASKNISEIIKLQYPEIPWQEMYYLRNRVMLEYFGIDYEVIWDVSKNYLPENTRQINKILKSL
jgi:uncharacterized protein with HEPN domain